MLRELGIFERALLISDRHSPFNVISVLQLENAPSPEVMRHALELIQQHQPLLQARISAAGKRPYFARLQDQILPFTVIGRSKVTQWLDLVEQEMNARLDITAGPLFRVAYIYSAEYAEVILTFHHTIMDAASGMELLDKLLRTCSDLQEGEQVDLRVQVLAPAVEERFPAPFKGARGDASLVRYAISQMIDEAGYQIHMPGKRRAPVKLGGRGFPLSLTLPGSLVEGLSRRCRIEKITLNSLLNAVLLLSVNRHLYAGQRLPMRTFSFADLRPYTESPTPPDLLANYISMLRYTLTVSGEQDIWDLSKDLHTKIYQSFKRGEKFHATKMSETLMKAFTGLKAMRMGTVALNYSGAVPLQQNYGDIRLVGLHAFLSSFDLGPEVSSQVRLFDDQLWWDFMFLDTDMDRSMANKIVDEVRSIMGKAIED